MAMVDEQTLSGAESRRSKSTQRKQKKKTPQDLAKCTQISILYLINICNHNLRKLKIFVNWNVFKWGNMATETWKLELSKGPKLKIMSTYRCWKWRLWWISFDSSGPHCLQRWPESRSCPHNPISDNSRHDLVNIWTNSERVLLDTVPQFN